MTAIPHLSAALGDRYRIEREIGAGGMATVFLARDLKHDRDVALKVLRPDLAAVLGTERFLQEIRIAARLDHPHILTLIDSGAADGLLYYVVPYVRGESLRAKLARDKQLAIDDAVAITRQVGSALDYAHRQGVVHRDIKPENILLHEGEAMLTDFGIALAVREAGGNRLTESGTSLGTPQYMSPEQATGDRTLDARSDVYSLGAVLYEMLAGEPPHTGATVQAVIAKLITERPTSVRVLRDTVPDALDRAVTKALAKVPADRYQSAAEFVAALDPDAAPAARSAGARLGRRTAAWGSLALVTVVVLTLLGIRIGRRGATTAPSGVVAAAAYDRIQVTTTGHATWPILSPNGAELVYVEETCTGDGSCRNGLEIRDLASNVERELLPDVGWAYPTAYSRDGSWLLINAIALAPGRTAGQYVMSRLGGALTFVSAGRGDMTPAGDSVLIASAVRGQTAVHFRTIALPVTQTMDSSPPASIGQLGEIDDARVAPDGRHVAVLWESAGAVLLAVYDRSGALIDTASVPSSAPFTLWWTSRARAVLMYVFSRRGEGALLRVAVEPSGKLGRRDTLVVTPGERGASAFSVSPDGHDLVFRIGQAGQNLLWTMAQQAPNVPPKPARLIRSASAFLAATLVKDGRTVIFGAGVPGPGTPRVQLFVEPFNGADAPRALTPALPNVVTWTPTLDGRRVVVETSLTGGRARLTAYDIATTRASPFAELSSSGNLAESGANGIAVVDAAAGAIRLFDGTGHERRRIAVADTLGYPYAIASSPNANAYAFLALRPDSQSGESAARQAFYQVSAATGRVQRIGWFDFGSESLNPFQWTADGAIRFGTRGATGSRPMLWRMPLFGGAARAESGLPFAPDQCACAMSSNGKRWVGEVSHPVSDIYIIRNFDADSTP